MPIQPSAKKMQFIDEAAIYLENPSLLVRLANMIGKPLELLVQGIDRVSMGTVNAAVSNALQAGLNIAIQTIPTNTSDKDVAVGNVGTNSSFWSALSVGVTGTAGGFFGLAGLPIELPLTTTIMFRSIAAIAKEFDEDLNDPDVRLQCLAVFSLGGPSDHDDDMETAYLTARVALDETITAATKFVVGKTTTEIADAIQKGTAPLLVRLIANIAERFSMPVTGKFIAQSLPIAGAIAGGTVNVAFMDHFNRVARFHFGIRKLEREFGAEFIQSLYKAATVRAKGKKFIPSPQLPSTRR